MVKRAQQLCPASSPRAARGTAPRRGGIGSLARHRPSRAFDRSVQQQRVWEARDAGEARWQGWKGFRGGSADAHTTRWSHASAQSLPQHWLPVKISHILDGNEAFHPKKAARQPRTDRRRLHCGAVRRHCTFQPPSPLQSQKPQTATANWLRSHAAVSTEPPKCGLWRPSRRRLCRGTIHKTGRRRAVLPPESA